MGNASKIQTISVGFEKRIKSLPKKNNKAFFESFDQIFFKRIINYLSEIHNIFIKQLTNIGLEWTNYFRVIFVSKPPIDKLIKASNAFSNKNFFSF